MLQTTTTRCHRETSTVHNKSKISYLCVSKIEKIPTFSHPNQILKNQIHQYQPSAIDPAKPDLFFLHQQMWEKKSLLNKSTTSPNSKSPMFVVCLFVCLLACLLVCLFVCLFISHYLMLQNGITLHLSKKKCFINSRNLRDMIGIMFSPTNGTRTQYPPPRHHRERAQKLTGPVAGTSYRSKTCHLLCLVVKDHQVVLKQVEGNGRDL